MFATITGGQAAIYAIGGFLVLLAVFVVQCVIIGWGVSIAMRTYRWCMRNHQPAQPSARVSKAAQPPADRQVRQFS